MTTFDEMATALAQKRKISYDEAALLVAERYRTVTETNRDQAETLLDTLEDVEAWDGFSYGRPVPVGHPIPIDSERSPQGMMFAAAERMKAKEEGDYYRRLSRRTSFHSPDDAR